MSGKELEISRKFGASTFSIYFYVKSFPRSRSVDIEADLGISDKTVTRMLKTLQDNGIIKRKMITNKIRHIDILPEKEWKI